MELVSTFFLPVFLGASHALEPGHGKTALTLFAVGARLNSRFVFSLIGGIVLSHTLVLLVTALALHLIAFGQDGFHFLHGVFGVIGSGILFLIAYRMLPRGEREDGTGRASGRCCSHHATTEATECATREKGEARTAGLIGMGGGLLPCPTAVAAFMTSLSSGAILEGVAAIFAFVLGMVLTLVGLALVANHFGAKFVAVQDADRGRYAYFLAAAIGFAGAFSLYLAIGEFIAVA